MKKLLLNLSGLLRFLKNLLYRRHCPVCEGNFIKFEKVKKEMMLVVLNVNPSKDIE